MSDKDVKTYSTIYLSVCEHNSKQFELMKIASIDGKKKMNGKAGKRTKSNQAHAQSTDSQTDF